MSSNLVMFVLSARLVFDIPTSRCRGIIVVLLLSTIGFLRRTARLSVTQSAEKGSEIEAVTEEVVEVEGLRTGWLPKPAE